MKRVFIAGLMFEALALIIGLTWITPWAHRSLAATPAPQPSASATQTPAAAVPAVALSSDVAVSLSQWAVTPDATTIPAGKLTFHVANAGSITHEFVVLKTNTPAANIPIGSFEGEKDRINEDTAGTNVGETGDMNAGTKQDLTLTLVPGNYVFLCNLPAHYGLGMHTDVTVVASTESAPAASGTTSTVPVSLSQWAVAPSTTTIPAGKVKFQVTNKGSITHEFVVLQTDTPSADIPIGSFEGEQDRINEDTAGTNVGETGDMKVGASKTLTLNLAPGHYVFLCNLPAHYGSGMHVDVTITAA